MEALRRMILEKGKGIGNDIVKVDMFLNHRIDTALLFPLGQLCHDALCKAVEIAFWHAERILPSELFNEDFLFLFHDLLLFCYCYDVRSEKRFNRVA